MTYTANRAAAGERLRVFIVDDHPMARAGLRSMIEDHVDVVGEADEVEAAVELIEEREPDLVLLDVKLPGGGGKAVALAIRKTHPDVRLLAVSVSDEPQDVIGLIRAGASGYVIKEVESFELLQAIETVAEGGAWFSAGLAAFVREAFEDEAPVGDTEFDSLTPRERQVVDHIAKGRSNPEIAEWLGISVKTVEQHNSNIFRKLQVTSRYEVIRWADQHGF
jgi:DNA-binding NarL/FixJ family response regulator